MSKINKNTAVLCPCGSAKALPDCCGACHSGQVAATPEALMRSRYSAYVLGLEDYLLATWHVSTRPLSLDLAADTPTKWLGLSIKATSIAGEQGQVEFVARYKVDGRAYRLHENSRFVHEDGRWFYVDGDVTE